MIGQQPVGGMVHTSEPSQRIPFSGESVKIDPRRIEIVNLRPGDKLVVYYDGHITKETEALITQSVERWAGDGVKVAILSHGLRLGVLRQEQTTDKKWPASDR